MKSKNLLGISFGFLGLVLALGSLAEAGGVGAPSKRFALTNMTLSAPLELYDNNEGRRFTIRPEELSNGTSTLTLEVASDGRVKLLQKRMVNDFSTANFEAPDALIDVGSSGFIYLRQTPVLASGEKTRQPIDLELVLDDVKTNKEIREGNESCSYTDYRRECDWVSYPIYRYDRRGRRYIVGYDRRWECHTVAYTRYGTQWVKREITDTLKSLSVNGKAPGQAALLTAKFSSHEVTSIVLSETACR